MTDLTWPVDPAPAEDIASVNQGGAVRIEVLRHGARQSPLFLAPGITGQPDELGMLARMIDTPQAVIGLAPCAKDTNGLPIDSVERIAELLIAAIRSIQPVGPYRLGGYSFGALVAFEIAHQLRTSGESIDALVLIDPVFDERYWPCRIWLAALLRRTSWQLRTIAGMRPGEALDEFRFRAARLGKRLLRRVKPEGGDIRSPRPDVDPVRDNALSAMGRYRPRFYGAGLALIGSNVNGDFGCRTTALWDGLATFIETWLVPGDHLSMLRDPVSLKLIAEVISRRLETCGPSRPQLRPEPGFSRPMLLSTMHWFSSARVAHSLVEAGFTVTSCRPSRHPLALVAGTGAQFRLALFWPIRSLRTAIVRAAPDIILPDDERSIELLRTLHDRVASEDPALAALISRSLGGGEFKGLHSRTETLTEARQLGVACPTTRRMTGPEALASWPTPFVLKTDESWGGRGVAIVRRTDQIYGAWRRLSRPPSFLRAMRLLVVDQNFGNVEAWLRRRRPVVNAQAFVEGTRAIATAACNDGRTLGLVCLAVVHSAEPYGPATVVRIIDNPVMAEAVKRIVHRFELSGFIGMDFLIDAQGVAQLVEINSRVTPTCHLLIEGQARGAIALFPQEHLRDPGSTFKLDIPERSPALIKFAVDCVRKRARVSSRLFQYLGRQFTKQGQDVYRD